MKSKKMYLIGIISLLLTTSLFYWFQIRPEKVRKECVKQAHEQADDKSLSPEAKKNLIDTFYPTVEGPARINERSINNYYRLCLANHGLKPESLFVNIEK